MQTSLKNILVAFIGMSIMPTSVCAQPSQAARVLVRGGGRTIIEGGTGQAGGFVPVITTIAFHAERAGQAISGDFECLALAPAAPAGNGSGQFTVNAMYVTGEITSVEIEGDTATLKGTATVTGLGAGHNLPFTLAVRKGGPGATSVLTVSGLTFHEILLNGSFEVAGDE